MVKEALRRRNEMYRLNPVCFIFKMLTAGKEIFGHIYFSHFVIYFPRELGFCFYGNEIRVLILEISDVTYSKRVNQM